MKKILVLLFMAIFIAGISQSNEEMKYVNRNKIEYGGEIINIKKAMELSEGVSEDAKSYFLDARLHPIRGVVFITIPLLTKFGIDLIERESYVGGVACLYLAGSHTFALCNPDKWKISKIEEGIKEYNSAIKKVN
jgi:hypothetical protein